MTALLSTISSSDVRVGAIAAGIATLLIFLYIKMHEPPKTEPESKNTPKHTRTQGIFAGLFSVVLVFVGITMLSKKLRVSNAPIYDTIKLLILKHVPEPVRRFGSRFGRRRV